MPLPMHAVERKTSLHDGAESYIKLGQIYEVKEEGGKSFAEFLINAALDWARGNARKLGK